METVSRDKYLDDEDTLSIDENFGRNYLIGVCGTRLGYGNL